MALRRAEEYSISDVRRCLRAQPDQITARECREICKNARLRYLTQNPLRTLQSYKTELQIYLDYGNPETHYIEGIKHYFGFYNARRGLKHLKISATNNFEHLDLLHPFNKIFCDRDSNPGGFTVLDFYPQVNDYQTTFNDLPQECEVMLVSSDAGNFIFSVASSQMISSTLIDRHLHKVRKRKRRRKQMALLLGDMRKDAVEDLSKERHVERELMLINLHADPTTRK
ncbi:hypothetical protein Bca4012_011969 [Brassica carinata]